MATEINKETAVFFKTIREAWGLNQTGLGTRSGVSQSTISQLENADITISEETLFSISTALGINSKYVIDPSSQNPFSSNKLIKFYLTNFSRIDFIMKSNNKLDFCFLIPDKPLLELLNKTVFEKPIYAIAIKDGDGNLFLFRGTKKSIYSEAIVGTRELQVKITRMKKSGKIFSTEHVEIDKELYDKIYAWTVEIADILPLIPSNPKKSSDIHEMIDDLSSEDQENLRNALARMKKKNLKVIDIIDESKMS